MKPIKKILNISLIILLIFACDISSDEVNKTSGIEIVYNDKQINASESWTYSFKDTLVSQSEIEENIFIKNIGNNNLVISSINMEKVSGTDSFKFEKQPEYTIKPGKKSNFKISYKPESGVESRARVIITCNDPSNKEFIFYLSGSGVNLYKPEIEGDQLTDNQTPQWSWSVPDNTQSLKYRLNGGEWIVTNDITTNSYTPEENLQAGENTFEIQFIFNDGVVSEISSFKTTVDLSNDLYPVISGSELTNNNDITWNWTIPDIATQIRHRVNNGSWNTTSDLSLNSYSFKSDLEGINVFELQIADSSGNWTSTVLYKTELDTTPPAGIVIKGDSISKSPRPTFTWTSAVEFSAVKYNVDSNDWTYINDKVTSITLQDNLSEGNHTINISISDKAGNWSETASFETLIDYDAVTELIVSGDKYSNKDLHTWSWIVPVGTAKIRYRYYTDTFNSMLWKELTDLSINSATTGAFVEETYYFHIQAADIDGNWFPEKIYTTVIDRTAPKRPVYKSNRYQGSKNPTWKWEFEDDADYVSYKLNDGEWVTVKSRLTTYISESELTSGSHTLYVKAGDKSGNWSTELVNVVDLDFNTPSKLIVTGIDRTNNKTPEWNWRRPENESMLALQYRFRDQEWIDRSTLSTFFKPEVELADGTYNFQVRYSNKYGNWSEPGEYQTIIDATPPSIPVISGPQLSNENTVTWSWNVSEDTKRVKYRSMTNGSYSSWSITFNLENNSYTSRYLAEGQHSFEVQACDDLDNWSESGIHTVTIDRQAPVKGIISGDVLTNNKRPTWTVTVPDDFFKLSYRINSGEWKEANEKLLQPDNDLTDGNYTVEVKLSDEAGNWSEIAGFTTEIDITPPNKPNLYGTASPTIDKRPTWQWVFNSEVKSYKYRFDEGPWRYANHTMTEQFTPDNELEIGNHKFELVFIDKLGNESDSDVRIIEVINEPMVAPEIPGINYIETSHFFGKRIDIYIEDNSKYEDGFILERKVGDSGVFEVIRDTEGFGSVVRDTHNLHETVKYTYRAKAYNEFGESDYSPEKTIEFPVINKGFTNCTLIDNELIYGNKVQWIEDSEVETGFNIYRKDEISGDFVKIKELPSSARSFVDTTTPEYGEITYRLTVLYDDNGITKESAPNDCHTTGMLINPADLEITGIDYDVKLNWLDKSNEETGYRIFRREAGHQSSDEFELIDTVSANTSEYIDNKINVYSSYYGYDYKVVAFKTLQNSEILSNSLVINSSDYIMKSPYNLEARSTSDNEILFSWWFDDTQDYTGIIVELYEGFAGHANLIDEFVFHGKVNSKEFKDLKLATRYSFSVRTFKGEIKSARRSITKTTKVAAPENLRVVTNTATSVELTWDHSSVSGCWYVIRRNDMDTPSGAFEVIGRESSNVFIDSTGIKPAGRYRYSVHAEKEGGESTPIYTFATTADLPTEPVNPEIIPIYSSAEVRGIGISWDRDPKHTGYNIVKYYRNSKVDEFNIPPYDDFYLDKDVVPGNTYRYELSSVDKNGKSNSISLVASAIPDSSYNLTNVNEWSISGITKDHEVQWFYVYAEKGKEYNIYWDDEREGSGVYNADINVTVYHKDLDDWIYPTRNHGYNTPITIQSQLKEIIYIKVECNNSRERGLYSIKVTKN